MFERPLLHLPHCTLEEASMLEDPKEQYGEDSHSKWELDWPEVHFLLQRLYSTLALNKELNFSNFSFPSGKMGV